MPGKKKGAPLSTKPRDVKRREDAAAARKAAKDIAAAGGGDAPAAAADPGVSNGSIGVQTPEKPTPQAYHCSNCDGDVTQGDSKCPTCEIPLRWGS